MDPEDIKEMNGNMYALLDKLQEKYGYSNYDAQIAVNHFVLELPKFFNNHHDDSSKEKL